MHIKKIILPLLSISLAACNTETKKNPGKIDSTEDIGSSIKEAAQNTKHFTGRFYKIEKIGEHDYSLQLITGKDSITTFTTLMPLDETEIGHLKKDGDNVEINYQDYYNPVKKETIKIIKAMRPIYDSLYQ